jgi:hypothetical protein
LAVNFIQPSFAAGEISPNLYARVDLAKYHIAAKLLRNFFTWPSGGVSNRAGTMFVGRCKNSSYPVHLIPFQFNLIQTYILEFGHLYMRVIMNGGYVLEPAIAITGITLANPGVITSAGHGYSNGDQVFITGTGTQIDSTPGRQYLVQNATTNTFTLTDLDGNVINTTAFTAYGGSGGTVARVFTLTTPYAGTDVQAIKWTQSNDTLTLCHPSYPPVDLTRTQHWVWMLIPINFAPQVEAPTGVTFTNTRGTSGYTDTGWNYSYVVTAVSDTPPDESFPSTAFNGTGVQLNSAAGAYNNISWKGFAAAQYYRVYKANPTYALAINPANAMYGYIGMATGTSFVDTEIAPDFTQSPPQGTNPFMEGPITSVTVLNGGTNCGANLTVIATDISGTGAVLTPTIAGGVITKVTVTNGGQNYQAPVISLGNQGSGAVATLTVLNGVPVAEDQLVTVNLVSGGQNYFGPVNVTAACPGSGLTFTPQITNGVITGVKVTGMAYVANGYTDGASLVFTNTAGSGATFRATVTPSGNYPSCATYFQQRKVFGGSNTNPQTIWMTRPADFKNMDISNPSQASDAIVATIASNQVNAVKWLIPMNNLVVLSSGGAWLMIGGAIASPVAVTPTNTIVVPQNYIGCGDLPPIVINYDILYVQAKGSIVRDLAYNFWVNVYTGTDMSVLAQHLFFGHNMERWAYAEQPFYQVWIVRDDGILLSFTYLKEQDVYAWAHHDSFGNSGTDTFESVASIPEQQIPGINVDSVYFVTQRTIPGINGGNTVKYVERMNARNFLTNGVSDVTKAWFVDCGLQYSGTPATVISGLDHLNGATVSILADGSVQPQQVVSGGTVTLQNAASLVTVGLGYVSQLQTLCMEPEGMVMQVQDYRKKLSAVAVRVADTRGLKVGPNFGSLTEIKERSASVSMGAAVPLFTGDERVIISADYLVDDDICIEQDNPLPCTVLGVIPECSVGDGPG